MRIHLGIVTRVFAQIDVIARTPSEIADRSGVGISKVIEVLDFLTEFGIVEVEGRKFRASGDIRALP